MNVGTGYELVSPAGERLGRYYDLERAKDRAQHLSSNYGGLEIAVVKTKVVYVTKPEEDVK